MYTVIAVAMLSMGVLMIVLSLVLMVVWHIPDLFDELTGKKAKRQIKALREANIGTGSFEGLTTSEISELMQQGSFSSGSQRLDKYEDLSKLDDEEEEEIPSQEVKRSVVRARKSSIPQKEETQVREDVRSNRVEKDRVAEAKWELIEEASSIF